MATTYIQEPATIIASRLVPPAENKGSKNMIRRSSARLGARRFVAGGCVGRRVWTGAILCLLAGTSGNTLAAQHSRALFDGQSLAGWEITDFGGQGPVAVHNGAVILAAGDPMTGITWKEEFPRINYEVTLEAMRLQGHDFFSAITFPVNDDPCTLVLGGWGGSTVGLSSIEGADASQNETSRSIWFDDERWYRIRLRVTEEKIQAWIDQDLVVDFPHAGRELSIRMEVWQNQPFGIASYYTTAAVRNIHVSEIRPGDTAR
jgi:hypothetical protein